MFTTSTATTTTTASTTTITTKQLGFHYQVLTEVMMILY